ncbi:hypothetical protein EMIHUDRAFT_458481 [Emiliania huxleyi CCMP1516]|uniref:Uncharacterized protein n=2 Tax=Emiliania huxleyi TaxID=2903 RepID=A0A0D3JBK2_EMIH1|nr:hypothetical protein EMIHUDRAFT_458481 [Emiliania huxleyi CCMP1516]EOD20887.1 hypothetical protein EMIHUDRAFT_458481 [Emiliania huxleyi CCMP1516]|eukprot:XP_005773316.1 hypothetical protein EMIHUDRAFT_458481 [Emiliania huxleyi CCMP1516]
MTVALFLSAAVALTPGPALRTTPAVRPAVAPALLAAASDESDKAIVSKPVAIAIAAIAIGGGAVYGPAIVNNPIMQKAAKKAIGGGLSGAIAGVVQVLALMWMRTVDGAAAYKQLGDKVKREGPVVLYQGALANAVASFVGSYPWFFAFNLAMRWLPAAPVGDLLFKLVRSAVAGVIASFVSDVFSNFIRVLKTTRQQASMFTVVWKYLEGRMA